MMRATDGPKTGLVLQGGGARGAYQIGVLKAVAAITGSRRNPFPIISGSSVGAINAAPLAASTGNFQRGVAYLEKLWRGLHCDSVFATNPSAIIGSSARWLWTLTLGGLGGGNPGALLDNTPLHDLLRREFKREAIEQALRHGALDALCISASSYRDGRAITFFESRDSLPEWNRARRHGQRATITVDHLMASCALPFLFNAVNLDGQYFGDGALRLTAPLSPAIRMGAQRLFIIGAREDSRDSVPREALEYPTIGELAGHALDILFNDDLDADLERLLRVNDTVSLLPQEARTRTPLRVIDTLMLRPSRDLRKIADEHGHEMPRSIRLLMRRLGTWGHEGRLLSYLLFEPGYIGALIDMAFEDCMDRADEIAEFLAVPRQRLAG